MTPRAGFGPDHLGLVLIAEVGLHQQAHVDAPVDTVPQFPEPIQRVAALRHGQNPRLDERHGVILAGPESLGDRLRVGCRSPRPCRGTPVGTGGPRGFHPSSALWDDLRGLRWGSEYPDSIGGLGGRGRGLGQLKAFNVPKVTAGVFFGLALFQSAPADNARDAAADADAHEGHTVLCAVEYHVIF